MKSSKKFAKRLRMSEANQCRLQVVEESEPAPMADAPEERPHGSAGVKRELESAVKHLQEDEAGDDASAAGPIKTRAKIASDESVENATEKVRHYTYLHR